MKLDKAAIDYFSKKEVLQQVDDLLPALDTFVAEIWRQSFENLQNNTNRLMS